jgi:adenosylcobyric acid synthase
MLGEAIADPQGIEGMAIVLPGLGLLPVTTVITTEKVTRQRSTQASVLPKLWSQFDGVGGEIYGYEIHQGQTQVLDSSDLAPLFADSTLGVVSLTTRVMGTYLHDLFGNGSWRRMWLNQLREGKGQLPLDTQIPNYAVQRDWVLDNITDAVAPHLDLSRFFDG